MTTTTTCIICNRDAEFNSQDAQTAKIHTACASSIIGRPEKCAICKFDIRHSEGAIWAADTDIEVHAACA